MRVVLLAESFLPQMNGVTNSLLHMLRHLAAEGHEALVIAPRGETEPESERLHGAALSLLRSFPLPSYPEVRVTVASAGRLKAIFEEFRPDVVHLAAPFVLGWQGLRAADALGIPTVAIYQTDIPGYADRYGIAPATAAFSQHVARLHNRASLTLAPSSAAIQQLTSLGVDRVRLWARGVDGERFAPARRSTAWRERVAPAGEVVIGYVGRLAPEKQVEDLAALAGIPGARIVIVGDGPSRPALEKALPGAVFLGFLGGDELAEAVASFDVFVHPGENETFCQTVQEALASGVPVVATGRGGPLDLVQSSRTGWLYRPGDLADLRARVEDLVGDPSKRAAFARAARDSVAHRTWTRLGEELVGHYRDAMAMRTPGPAPARWHRYVALGDSITEGLCDDSRQQPGEYRGWADRLAMLLVPARGAPLQYANLAVRSRRVADVLGPQLGRALDLRPDLVSILIGGNDLSAPVCAPRLLAARLGTGISRLRESGAQVLVIAPFVPPQPFLRGFSRRALRFAAALRRVAEENGAIFIDPADHPEFTDPRMWHADRVHLSSAGHRALAYRAAEALGVSEARRLGELDATLHDEASFQDDDGAPLRTPAWLWEHARPYLWRRVRGVTAGDGVEAKHSGLVPVGRPDAERELRRA